MKRALVLVALAVVLAAPMASAAQPVLRVHPTDVRFGRQAFESFATRSFTIQNRSAQWLRITLGSIQMPDDFSPGQIESSCALGDTWLGPGQRCTHVIGFRPTPYFAGHETASMRVTAHDEAGTRRFERLVRISGQGVDLVGGDPVLDLDPSQVRFGRQPFGSHSERGFTITNRSDEGLWVTVEQLDVPDDFSPGQPESTCPLGSAYGATWLAPGQGCEHVIGFDPSPFFCGPETARLIVTAHDEEGNLHYARIVELSGTALDPEAPGGRCSAGR
jgi:hypothetical protein